MRKLIRIQLDLKYIHTQQNNMLKVSLQNCLKHTVHDGTHIDTGTTTLMSTLYELPNYYEICNKLILTISHVTHGAILQQNVTRSRNNHSSFCLKIYCPHHFSKCRDLGHNMQHNTHLSRSRLTHDRNQAFKVKQGHSGD